MFDHENPRTLATPTQREVGTHGVEPWFTAYRAVVLNRSTTPQCLPDILYDGNPHRGIPHKDCMGDSMCENPSTNNNYEFLVPSGRSIF